MTRRPQVVAHRGASADEPEHTLAAYRRAIEVGADGVECDVRLTADGHLVCLHDRRVNRTSNGSGLVSALRLAQLEALDWGASPPAVTDGVPGLDRRGGPQPVGRDPEGSRLLTLRRLLAEVQAAPRPVEVAIETKHPTRYGASVERALVGVLREFGWSAGDGSGDGRVRVMSFSILALRRMSQLAPEIPLVFLTGRAIPLPGGVLPARTAVGVGLALLRRRPGYLARVHRAGRPLHVWTVDEQDDVRRCRDAGAAAIITNRPDRVIGWLDALEGRRGGPGGEPGGGGPEPRGNGSGAR